MLSQFSDIKDVKNCWVIETRDKIQTLVTANGTKTISQLLGEAHSALQAIAVPSNYAYELTQIVCPSGDGTGAQTGLDISSGPSSLTYDFSAYTLRAYKIMQIAAGVISIYTLYLQDQSFSAFSTNINSKQITGGTTFATQKPSSGTTLYIRYNVWKKI